MTIVRSLDVRQQRFLRQQVAISIAINALIPTTIIWLIGVAPPDALLGNHAILPGMMMGSGLATLFMTVGLTLAVRSSLQHRKILPLPLAAVGWLSRMLPAPLLARGLSMALLAMLVLVPCGTALLTATPLLPLSAAGFVVWNMLYGAAVGLTMTPLVVRRALADPSVIA